MGTGTGYTAGGQTLRFADGRVENQKWKAGAVLWSKAGGKHTDKNLHAGQLRHIHPQAAAASQSIRGAVNGGYIHLGQNHAPVDNVIRSDSPMQFLRFPRGD